MLRADGLTDDEIDMRLSGVGGGKVADVRQNALAVLIAAGARVERSKGAQSDEAAKKEELRRKQKNIGIFLQKEYDIDPFPPPPKSKGDAGHEQSKGRRRSASDVANDAKRLGVGSSMYKREIAQMNYARTAREKFVSMGPAWEQMLAAQMMERRGELAPASKLSAEDLAAILREEDEEEEMGGMQQSVAADSSYHTGEAFVEEGEEELEGNPKSGEWDA